MFMGTWIWARLFKAGIQGGESGESATDVSLKVDIHTLWTNSWQLIENAPLSYTMHMFCQFSYVLVNGCLHWCRYPTKPLSIFSLDMGNE